MRLVDLMHRARKLTRDVNSSVFVESDIYDFAREAVERVKQIIPELSMMPVPIDPLDNIQYLPESYHHLLAVYAASRLFTQDERHYQASTLMNEYEFKMQELKVKMDNGEIVLTSPDGTPIQTNYTTSYVRNNYFETRDVLYDEDEGVDAL